MSYQSWDEFLQHPYLADLEFARHPFVETFNAVLENVSLLSQEFDYHTLSPGLSHGTLTLKPFKDKPMIFISCDKPGALCHIYHLRNQTATNEKWVPQEQLIPTVYEYIEQLKAL